MWTRGPGSIAPQTRSSVSLWTNKKLAHQCPNGKILEYLIPILCELTGNAAL